ncbi:MAG: hypothetical protein V9G18_16215 [Albidovulum sp.]
MAGVVPASDDAADPSSAESVIPTTAMTARRTITPLVAGWTVPDAFGLGQ